MNKELLEILNNTKDWLKFAESKSAMLIAFNAASIYGVAKLPFVSTTENSGFWGVYFTGVIIFLIASTVVCLISFVPRLKFLYISISNIKGDNNVFFFEHLGQSTPKKIIESLIAKGVKDDFLAIDKDLAIQIHSLANVARRKYGLFTIAVWITVSAYVSPIIAGVFALYNYKK